MSHPHAYEYHTSSISIILEQYMTAYSVLSIQYPLIIISLVVHTYRATSKLAAGSLSSCAYSAH